MGDKRTIAEIRKALSQTSDPAMIESLRADPRQGVQALIRSWLRKQERLTAAAARAEKLYAPLDAMHAKGFSAIAGIDEAGRGPLAGPVVAACVVLPLQPRLAVDDSKKLSESKRESLYDDIIEKSLGYGIGFVTAGQIDELNIYRAARRAMTEAVAACRPIAPDFCFVDAMTLPDIHQAQQSLVHGDARCAAISAASIIAKVTRDRIMVEAAETYPGYGFERHKGYGAPEHLQALEARGPCPIHRMTFAPVKDYVLPSLSFFLTLIHRSTSEPALLEVGERIKQYRADLTEEELAELRHHYREQRNSISAGRQ